MYKPVYIIIKYLVFYTIYTKLIIALNIEFTILDLI